MVDALSYGSPGIVTLLFEAGATPVPFETTEFLEEVKSSHCGWTVEKQEAFAIHAAWEEKLKKTSGSPRESVPYLSSATGS